MDVVKDILEFFFTFGITDILIYYLFLRKVCNCPKNKWYQLLIFMIFSSISKILLFPIIHQIILLIFVLFYNILVNKFKIKESIKYCLIIFSFFLISESIYCILFEIFINIDLSKIQNYFELYLKMIPNKIINILIILFYREKLIWAFFGGEVIPKKK